MQALTKSPVVGCVPEVGQPHFPSGRSKLSMHKPNYEGNISSEVQHDEHLLSVRRPSDYCFGRGQLTVKDNCDSLLPAL